MPDTSRFQPAVQQLPRAKSLPLTDRLAWQLVALSPLLFAIASWSPAEERGILQSALLVFSLPITVVEVVVFLFAIHSGFRPMKAVHQFPPWARVALAVLAGIAVSTAAFVAVYPLQANIRTFAWAIHLLFGLGIWHLMRGRWRPLRQQVWPSILLGTLLYVAAVGALVIAIPNEATFDWLHLNLAVGHVRQVGFYSVVGAGAALGLAAAEERRGPYWAAVTAASLLLALSFWSGTRGSLVAIYVCFAAGFALLPAIRTARAVLAFIASSIAGAIMSLIHVPPHSFYGIFRMSRATAVNGVNEISTGRIDQWVASAAAVLERPWFGFGESQYKAAVPAWGQFNHPHNIFLQVLLQWGIVGLVCFLSLASLLAWHLIKSARKSGREAMPAFLVAGGLAIMSLYEGTLYHPYPVMMVALAAAFLLSAEPQIDDR